MSDYAITKTRLVAGIWEGVISTTRQAEADAPNEPQLAITHAGEAVTSFALTPDESAPNRWYLRIVIPPDILTDGVQVLLIADATTGETLDSITIITGEPLDDDIRAEVELLRAELDMLKRAFRRHCVETM